jgi:hypothetical protein
VRSAGSWPQPWRASRTSLTKALELTLYEDGSLKQVSLSGCTVEQARQFCRLIIQFDALADNDWLNPDEEHDDLATVPHQAIVKGRTT